jgi:hypothetical protein
VKIIADFNIGLLFSALNLEVTTKVAEPSCRYEGDGKKDLTVGAWLFMYVLLSTEKLSKTDFNTPFTESSHFS